MRHIVPLSALCVLCIFTGCRATTSRLYTSGERFYNHEVELAKNIRKNQARSWDRDINRMSWSDDWERNVGREVDLVKYPPTDRRSVVSRFFAWEKANAKIYSDETVDRVTDAWNADGFKPTGRKFIENELAYKWYSSTEMPYRHEHPFTKASTFGKIVGDDKEVAQGTTAYFKKKWAEHMQDIEDFGPYAKEFFAREMRPFP